MNLLKLQMLREGQRVAVEQQLQEIEDAKEGNVMDDFLTILESLEELTVTLKSLDEDILNKMDPENIVNEVQETAAYTLTLKRKVKNHRKFYANSTSVSTSASCTGNTNMSSGPTMEISQQQQQQQFQDQQQQQSATSLPISAPSQQVSVSSSAAHFHKLPKLALPTFDGDLLLWQTFWDSFESSVHTNPALSDVQKFSYLKAQLTGDAMRTIDGFALTNANYHQALSLLKERYGQTHKITSAYVQALVQLPAPSDNIGALRNFYDRMETNIRGLESLGEMPDHHGNLLIPIILEKLPANTRRHLAREHGTGKWSLPDLRRAIHREIEILEAGRTSDETSSHSYKPTACFFTGTKQKSGISEGRFQKDSTTRTCVYCNQSHTGECQTVSDTKTRSSIVKSKGLCFNCLSAYHHVGQCKSKWRCRQCRGKHHTSICGRSKIQRNKRERFPTSLNSQNSAVCRRSENSGGGNSILHATLQPSKGDVLLKTAVARVGSEQYEAQANILMDEGAQRSFISQRLADELHLRREGSENICLSTFGDSTTNIQRLDTATVYLIANDNETIPIRVLIVPIIAKPVSNWYQKSLPQLKYLEGLRLAHPVTMDRTFEISLLIGADYYWQIVGDRRRSHH